MSICKLKGKFCCFFFFLFFFVLWQELGWLTTSWLQLQCFSHILIEDEGGIELELISLSARKQRT